MPTAGGRLSRTAVYGLPVYGLQGEVVTEHGDPAVADPEDLHH